MRFDVVVIGGGHAGCEAAAAAARRGTRVALVTMQPERIGAMSCNPAIGGVGKGHLVREVDVYDGIMARAGDAAAIHYRMLNRSKGAAVRGPRIQADRRRYASAVQRTLAEQPGLTIVPGEAAALRIVRDKLAGIALADGATIEAGAVVLASGTFLAAMLFRGADRWSGGRIGDRSSAILAAQMRELGGGVRRLKTGTPPRLDGRTIDWSRLERQPSDRQPWRLSAHPAERRLPQLACAITRTNPTTHSIVAAAADRSPLRSGAISGPGPRYCPSIEDKVRRFGDRDGHQVFLEPEGLDDPLVYPNGISTSLPAEDQLNLVRSVAGLERAAIVEAGYAVEYDYLDPRHLDLRLASRQLDGLFCAGQVNGTTGYEEAAAQGLVAGLNAAAYACALAPAVFDRCSSYIGVMIDDLTLQGVTEPYRMLTARADRRLHLRADNATQRLGTRALETMAVSPARRRLIENELSAVAACEAAITPSLRQQMMASDADGDTIIGADPTMGMHAAVLDQVLTTIRYAPYVARADAEQRLRTRDEAISLSPIDSFSTVGGLSQEMIERLEMARPATLAQAGRVPGITPAALTSLLVAARKAA